MDLNKLSTTDEAIKCVLTHPETGEPLQDDGGEDMYILVYGKDSAKFKRAFNDQVNKNLSQKKRKRNEYDIDSPESVELLAEISDGWNIQVDGKKPKFSKDEAVSVYKKWSWVKEQVESFIHDRSNFFTN